MTDTQMLAGSLSNDLFRVASLVARGSNKAASRFLNEAQRWSVQLEEKNTKSYIKNIAKDISKRSIDDISQESAEKYLMYGTLLQNYCLHSID